MRTIAPIPENLEGASRGHPGGSRPGRRSKIPSPHRDSWAGLLERVLAEEALRCPRGGGRRHRIAAITGPLVARRVLRHIGASYEPLPRATARGALSLARVGATLSVFMIRAAAREGRWPAAVLLTSALA